MLKRGHDFHHSGYSTGSSGRRIRTEIANTFRWLAIFQYTTRRTVGAENAAASTTICAIPKVDTVARCRGCQRTIHALTVFPVQQREWCVAFIAADDSIVIEPKGPVASWSGPTD